MDMKKFILAIASHKGGVGKTTLAFTLPYFLIKHGYKRVLLFDFDPQANLTKKFGISKKGSIKDFFDFVNENNLTEDVFLKALQILDDITVKVEYGDGIINVIGSELRLSKTKMNMQNNSNIIFRSREVLCDFCSDFDAVIIDLPPSIELMTVLALSVATNFIIPTTLDGDSIEGIADILMLYEEVKRFYNNGLTFTGIVPMRIDNRTILDRELKRQLGEHYKSAVFDVGVSNSVKVRESLLMRQFVGELYDKDDKVYQEFDGVTVELLKRIGAKDEQKA